MYTTQQISIAIALLIAVVIIGLAFAIKSRAGKKKNARPSIAKGFITYFNESYDQALSELRAIAEKDGCPPEIFLMVALIYKKQNDYMKAAQILEVMLLNKELDAQYKRYLKTELADNYLLANVPVKAINTLQDENTSDEDNTRILAFANYLISNYDNAIAFSNKYKKQSGKSLFGFNAKCLIAKANETNDYNKSVKLLKQAIAEMPTCKPARFKLASLHSKNGQHSKAFDEYNAIIKNDYIRHVKDVEDIRHAFITTGKESTLIETLVNAKLIQPSSAWLSIAAAITLELHGNHTEAVKTLKQFIEEHKNAIAIKEYAKLTEDKATLSLFDNIKPCTCQVCGTKYAEYREDCSTCLSFDSIS